jgi:hypothetical protein
MPPAHSVSRKVTGWHASSWNVGSVAAGQPHYLRGDMLIAVEKHLQ